MRLPKKGAEERVCVGVDTIKLENTTGLEAKLEDAGLETVVLIQHQL